MAVGGDVRAGRRERESAVFGCAEAVEHEVRAELEPLEGRDQVERRRQRALLLHVPHPQRTARVLPLVVGRVLRNASGDSSLFTVHCSLFTVHCSLFTVHCSLFTAH